MKCVARWSVYERWLDLGFQNTLVGTMGKIPIWYKTSVSKQRVERVLAMGQFKEYSRRVEYKEHMIMRHYRQIQE